MSYQRLLRRLGAGEVVVLDGATGTELQRRGVPMDAAAWCGPAALEHQAELTRIHADYIAAGAEVITANTFASSRLMLSAAGFADRVEEINRRAVEAALRARDEAPGGAQVVVAGSLSHMVPMASGTAAADPRGTPPESDLAEAFAELAQILRDAGAELILLEMMYHPLRARLALEAALASGLPVWFGLSARRADDGRAVSFLSSAERPLEEIAGLIPATGVDAAGVMHTGADLIDAALEVVRGRFRGPLMAYPDSGFFEMPQWRFVDVIPPARFEEFCSGWIRAGVQIVGGCCGLTVDHVRAAVRARERASGRARVRPRKP